MQKIKLLTQYDQHKAGSVVMVPNNIAHGLIESGKACLVLHENKMLEPSRTPKKKQYEIK